MLQKPLQKVPEHGAVIYRRLVKLSKAKYQSEQAKLFDLTQNFLPNFRGSRVEHFGCLLETE